MGSDLYDVVVLSCLWNGRGGWRCEAVVLDVDTPDEFDADTEPKFVMTIAEAEMRLFDRARPDTLAEASLRFLLDREPRDSILSAFGTADIRRYFPEFDAVIGGYLPDV